MRIIAKSTIREFWEMTECKDAEQELKSWYTAITNKRWESPHEIIAYFQVADNVGNTRIVFKICRYKYRLSVAFSYDIQVGFICFIDPHKQCDQIKDIKNI